jgi:hypothetical protein
MNQFNQGEIELLAFIVERYYNRYCCVAPIGEVDSQHFKLKHCMQVNVLNHRLKEVKEK